MILRFPKRWLALVMWGGLVVMGAEPGGEEAIKRFKVAPGLSVDLVASEPLLQNVVSFGFDRKGNMFVVETHRRRTSVFDIRNFPTWLDADYSFRTVEDRARFFQAQVSGTNAVFMGVIGRNRRGGFTDFDGDGVVTWKDMEVESEVLRLLKDTDGNGRFDTTTVVARGFDSSVSGVAAGVLTRGTNVWFACIPDLWRLGLKREGEAPVEPLTPPGRGGGGVERMHSGFGVHIAFGGHDMHGLQLGPDGRLYWSIADRGSDWRPEFVSRFFPGVALKELIPDTGAIFRCNLDGSGLEVVAVGLRNPQELAFDDFGNLWTGENNADGGDKARWVYVMPGSDSGWRIGWQWQNRPKLGAWNAEGLWWNAPTNTGAYVLPHAGYVGRGPAGVAWYPGTGMPAGFEGRFLMCDFPDGVRSFGVKPRGAGFEVIDDRPFLWGIFATDVDFAPGGGAYVSDWVEGWDKTGKGRVYRVASEAALKDPVAVETRQLLAAGLAGLPVTRLEALLGHKDQRVRLEAQWVLAARGEHRAFGGMAQPGRPLLARCHAIWGLGQLRRAGGIGAGEALTALRKLLSDGDVEVRVQAVRTLGECGDLGSADRMAAMLADPSLRLRSAAAISLGQVGAWGVREAVFRAIRANGEMAGGPDPWLRHGLVMALVGCTRPVELPMLAGDPSEELRLCAVLALRRWQDLGLLRFLSDPSPVVRLEVVRAIYDQGMTALYPVLASMAVPPGDGASGGDEIRATAVAVRVANARFRVGRAADVAGLAAFAEGGHRPRVRAEALDLLSSWGTPLQRDRVTGHTAPQPARPEGEVRRRLLELLPGALAPSQPEEVLLAAVQAVQRMALKPMDGALAGLVSASAVSVEVRSEALRALAGLGSGLMAGAIEQARGSGVAVLKKVADGLAANAAGGGLAELTQQLESGGVAEQQAALARLGKVEGAGSVLESWLGRLAEGKVRMELALDLMEAALAQGNPALKTRVETLRGGVGAGLAGFREALVGGDALAGRRWFLEKQELGCQRCHSIVKGDGGEVGPVLGGVGSRLTREQLLESIVRPNATIAPGFEQVVVAMSNGQSHAGLVRGETAEMLELLSAEDGLLKLRKADVKSRARGLSSMPEGMTELMSRRELRDLVEFLAGLK